MVKVHKESFNCNSVRARGAYRELYQYRYYIDWVLDTADEIERKTKNLDLFLLSISKVMKIINERNGRMTQREPVIRILSEDISSFEFDYY